MKSPKFLISALAGAMTLGGVAMAFAGEFNAEQWKAQRGVEASENARQGMIPELEKILRAGMSREEVIALLGEPDIKENNRFEYELGLLGFGVDYAWYVIEFDEEKRLKNFGLVQG